jgi:hypothetical protein
MRFKHLLPQDVQHEPVGIVIADGGRVTPPTRFSAFVWGPVPDDQELIEEPKALATASA